MTDMDQLKKIEAEARRYAEMYPQSSDGRNTFLIFADWVASLAPPSANLRICQACEGVGRVVGEDGTGFRPSRSDYEEADECADCGGTGYRHDLPFLGETLGGLSSLTIRK